jgi:hypothetical protein
MSGRGSEPQDPDEALMFSVASVWREARVSCPHPDLLRAWRGGSLAAEAAEFLRFHVEESLCPYCGAVLEEMGARDADARAGQQLESMHERLLRSTVAALRESRARPK